MHSCELKGMGHFTLGFLVGYLLLIVMLHLTMFRRRQIALYGAFLPHFLGTIAALPYALEILGFVSVEAVNSIAFEPFLFYGSVERSIWLACAFGNFHLDVVMVGLIYLHLVIRYIGLIQTAHSTHA